MIKVFLSKIDKKGSNTLKDFLDSNELNKQETNIISGFLAPMIALDTEWTSLSDNRHKHKIKGLKHFNYCDHFYDGIIEEKTYSQWSKWSDCSYHKSKRSRSHEWRHISFTSTDNEFEERDCYKGSIMINVVSRSNNYAGAQWYHKYLSGRYQIAQWVNGRPAYKREEKTEGGNEVFLWYNSKLASWHLSDGYDFSVGYGCYMYIKSPERDVTKLNHKWFENIGDDIWDWRETATVTIS